MSRRNGHAGLTLAFLALVLLAGYLIGVRLPEERRSRIKKLLYEVKEMPFRVLV